MLSWLYQIIKVLLLLVLPFILLIRGAVFFHAEHEWFPWMALLGGMGAAILILVLYLSFFHGRISGRLVGGGVMKRRAIIALILVAGYCIHGLLFFSGSNTKTESVKKEFTDLHPILRLGVSTLVFLDSDLILTDASRQPEDYRKMGLSTKSKSLHYQQSNGYVHAVDIRTKGRSEFRNTLLRLYFKVMGFNTLRHVGTADHLHISLMSHDSRGGI